MAGIRCILTGVVVGVVWAASLRVHDGAGRPGLGVHHSKPSWPPVPCSALLDSHRVACSASMTFAYTRSTTLTLCP
jgi:hypothetical protein